MRSDATSVFIRNNSHGPNQQFATFEKVRTVSGWLLIGASIIEHTSQTDREQDCKVDLFGIEETLWCHGEIIAAVYPWRFTLVILTSMSDCCPELLYVGLVFSRI